MNASPPSLHRDLKASDKKYDTRPKFGLRSDALTLELAPQLRPPEAAKILSNEESQKKVEKKKKSKQTPVLAIGESVTTIMMRNIPNRYTPEDLLKEVISRNFGQKFNYFYLPMDFTSGVNMGYAFINFLSSQHVDPFYREFHGTQLPKYTTAKIIEICPASTQGYVENVTKFLKGAARRIQNQFFRPLIFKADSWVPEALTKENLTLGISEDDKCGRELLEQLRRNQKLVEESEERSSPRVVALQ